MHPSKSQVARVRRAETALMNAPFFQRASGDLDGNDPMMTAGCQREKPSIKKRHAHPGMCVPSFLWLDQEDESLAASAATASAVRAMPVVMAMAIVVVAMAVATMRSGSAPRSTTPAPAASVRPVVHRQESDQGRGCDEVLKHDSISFAAEQRVNVSGSLLPPRRHRAGLLGLLLPSPQVKVSPMCQN